MRVELPEPSADVRAHSERVAAVIRDEIAAADGALDFARYMELALYAPGLGYYSAGAAKFGAAGDFVTAPELGSVFARCLARAVAPALRDGVLLDHDILELGPGSGALAVDLLRELERLDALPARYRMLERSADLRERQRGTIVEHCAHLLDRVEWLDAPPPEPWCGVLIANEVIDALPVRLFALRDEGVFVRNVAVDAHDRFVWREQAANATFANILDQILGDGVRTLPRPYSSEICTLLAPWLAEVARTLERGSAFLIDYGYAHGEYYHAQRSAGTLRCHYRHRAHDDPLILPGVQDITASVDFDALARAGAAAGFVVAAHSTQAQFLIAHGLDEVFAQAHAQASDEAARYALAQQVKRLTLPSEMGERFRVMELRR
ncbi:MAG TPA: SAM-dependent methyltransferase [Rudaea sp.]|jgi:SAM-dependent MidA family methyltransferase|uniref:class I SAM-dependent methyltransferase n=1 Tax=Rudaea sp. TaxID=2136325 RepID=UPI002F95225E